jgi:small nuclear ribonucleoprotein
MTNGIERPLDMLNSSRGKEVLVQLKNDTQIVGKLMAFDIHINVVLDNARELHKGEIRRSIGLTFVRGDTIIFISPASTTASQSTAQSTGT